MKTIPGMDSAVETAKSRGLNNMSISAPLVIEMAGYIAELEKMVASYLETERVWGTTMMRLVGEDGPADVEKTINKIKAQAQQATFDQFAMAVLPAFASQRHLTGIEAAAAAYNHAEAMQVESQKRRGGAV